MGFAGDILDERLALPGTSRHERLPSGQRQPTPFRWVPIRSLSERHRSRILAHLLALPQKDRYLRFGYAASDAQLSHYTDLIDFDQDEMFGIFNRRLALLAMAHLALAPLRTDGGPSQGEFGVSVLPHARGRGYGSRLFDRAMLHARNRQVDTLAIHALSENAAMLKIVRRAGAVVERKGGEAEAKLRLPAHDILSHVDELVESQAARLNYRLKLQAHRVASVIDAIDEVRDRFAQLGRVARE